MSEQQQVRGAAKPDVARGSLAGLLGGAQLPMPAVVAVAAGVAEALSAGVHGAVQPAAVGVDEHGGISLRAGLNPNPRYRAPEEKEGPPTARSDLHSLGRLLFELLLGEPYAPHGPVVPAGRIPALRRGLMFRRGLSEAEVEVLQEPLAGLLVMDPERRTPDAGRLLRSLSSWSERWDVDEGRRVLAEWKHNGPPEPVVAARVDVAPAADVAVPVEEKKPSWIWPAVGGFALVWVGLLAAYVQTQQVVAPSEPAPITLEAPVRPVAAVETAAASAPTVVAPDSWLSAIADPPVIREWTKLTVTVDGEAVACRGVELSYRPVGEEAWKRATMSKTRVTVGREPLPPSAPPTWRATLSRIQGKRWAAGVEYFARCPLADGDLMLHSADKPGWIQVAANRKR